MLTLVIGNKNLSSWSLRPWLVLKHFGIEFEEVKLPLDTPAFHRDIVKYSPTRRVPVLVDGAITIWDSLAIAEYLNEKVQGRAWPADAAARALARAVSAEMHSGFAALRTHWPMKATGTASVQLPPEGEADVARVQQLWHEIRSQYAQRGPWLFGEYSIADAMYAPVALRFRHYGAKFSSEVAAAYQQQLVHDAHMQAWIADSQLEVDNNWGTPA
ncbi:glutathione S-transferase family protein [Steroidobacter sp. S1-65]|uniref:Glutathione S-transferase family protein n=1 Tax=Steroidobacter gossypii TaxID=2805490 RepID=A0ABS1X2X2_9GAMM|nr:glutathione S-transferase family protein [Steroidobacter gossypii]MBM0107574.1 glutathione S-transferase family protein [Steroidobacter gossypii]